MYVAKPPSLSELTSGLGGARALNVVLQGLTNQGGGAAAPYLHWDKVRYLDPPDDLSREEWWLTMKMARVPLLRRLPLVDPDDQPFVYGMPDEVLKLLHFVDQRCAGEIAMQEVVTADEQAQQHYLVNSMMEEAIRSSQLEGATTSRRVAKELLRSGRPPKDRSERMILNNYHALQLMREAMGPRLTPAMVLELQRILTDGTLENPDAAGRLQTAADERVAVYDRMDGQLVHKPPPADQLPGRLQAMCDFANGRGDGEGFMHPVVRAILLHFWLAYDHPFEDGNGRTARALFYWSMRTQGYWLVEYLSISRILRNAPGKYTRAFLLAETDDRDTTYFIIYQLEVIRRAVQELHSYLRRKVREVQAVEGLLRGAVDFNHRQLALLSNAIRNPGRTYTFRSHAASHNVTHETARHDLLELEKSGLLERRVVGRQYRYSAPRNLQARLRRAA